MLIAGGVASGGIALAAPASAGCTDVWFGVGRTHRCDYPVQPDGWFRRCDAAIVLGFGGTNCYMVDINNLGPNLPYIP